MFTPKTQKSYPCVGSHELPGAAKQACLQPFLAFQHFRRDLSFLRLVINAVIGLRCCWPSRADLKIQNAQDGDPGRLVPLVVATPFVSARNDLFARGQTSPQVPAIAVCEVSVS